MNLEYIHTVIVKVKLLIAVALGLWALSAMSCKSPRHKPEAVHIVSTDGRYEQELYDAWYASRDKLVAVGAPVRDWVGKVEVSWKTGFVEGKLQGNRVWGLPGRTRGPVLYAQTFDSRFTWMSLTPDGAFQREVAEGEFSHFHLKMDEGLDYPWMRKAGLIP